MLTYGDSIVKAVLYVVLFMLKYYVCYLDENGNAPGAQFLRKVDVPTMSNYQCQYFLGRNNVHTSNICAGLRAGGKDACQVGSSAPGFALSGR